MKLDPQEVHTALSQALTKSLLWASRKPDISNSTRSARFASDVCRGLDPLVRRAFRNPTPRLRHIYVDDNEQRHAGEWLLDGVWTKDARPRPDERMSEDSPVRIRCALECESSTAGNEYHIDLAKLLVTMSDIKLFLAGLNQRTQNGVDDYINRRVYQTETVITQPSGHSSSTDWYLAFWPSPLMVRKRSLWQRLEAGEYAHLSRIHLYHLRENAFQAVTVNEHA